MSEFKQSRYIMAGGFVAIAIDESESTIFIVTHSGRGIVNYATGEKIERDPDVIYPEDGKIPGFGMFGNELIDVFEYDFENDLVITSPSGQFKFVCKSPGIQVYERI